MTVLMIQFLFLCQLNEWKSTNSWTTIAFIEGLARNIRRTLSVSITNACFYWIISHFVERIVQSISHLRILSYKIRDALSCFLRDVAKQKLFLEQPGGAK